jgi:hypothetical protein
VLPVLCYFISRRLALLFDLLRVAIFDCWSHNLFVISSDGRRFFVQDPDSGLHEAKKSDIVQHFKNTFEEEKSKLFLESNSSEEEEQEEEEEVIEAEEEVEEVDEEEEEEVIEVEFERAAVPDGINEDSSNEEGNQETPSKRRSSNVRSKKKSVTTTTITIGADGSRSFSTVVAPGEGVAAHKKAVASSTKSTPKQGGSDEAMLKTLTMYFPSSESGEKPSISEKVTPMSMCSEDVVVAVAIPSGINAAFVMPQSSTTAVSEEDPTTVPTYRKFNGSVYGRSIFQVPNSHNRLVAEADHEQFAPNKCIFCTLCVGDPQRARTYARVYENRLETNYPHSPWCCFTPEYCIVDNVMVYYFDKGPSQTYCGRFFAEIDCFGKICGPPVVFLHVRRCCYNLIDLRPFCGETIYAAPCDCYGLRLCCCIGRPCYEKCACPIAGPLKNGEQFLEHYRGAVDDYAIIRPVKRHTVFDRVSEKPCGFMCDKVTKIEPYPIGVSLQHCAFRLKAIPGAIPKALIMDRS